MSALPQSSETETRRMAMLRTAFDGPVGAALAAPDTIEILANPDGSVWVEKAGFGLRRAAETLGRAERERIIRLVASSVGEACDRASPIVSAELPGSGERFEGILPPVSEAPCFAIRKPAGQPIALDTYVETGGLPDLTGPTEMLGSTVGL